MEIEVRHPIVKSALEKVNIHIRYWRRVRARLYEIRDLTNRPETKDFASTWTNMIARARELAEPPMDAKRYEQLKLLVHDIRDKYVKENPGYADK